MAKNGILNTNTVTEFGVSITGVFTWQSKQDINANKDVVTWNLVSSNNPTGYYRTIQKAKVVVNGVVKSLSSSITAYNNTIILSGSLDIPHNNDGTKSFNVSVEISIGQSATNATASGTFVLDTIPRGNTYSINKTMLTSGQSATITITKAISTNKSTITWTRGSASGTILDKSTSTSASVSYDTLSKGMASGTNASVTITCISYNSSGVEVGERTTLKISISTGKIPLSLYDDGNGNVGATVGGRAVKSGFNVLVPIEVGTSAIPVNLELLNAYGINNYEVIWSGTDSSYAEQTLTTTKRLETFKALIVVTETQETLHFDWAILPPSQERWDGLKIRVASPYKGRNAYRNISMWYTGVTVGNAYYYPTYGSTTTTQDNSAIVPRYIIGVHI